MAAAAPEAAVAAVLAAATAAAVLTRTVCAQLTPSPLRET